MQVNKILRAMTIEVVIKPNEQSGKTEKNPTCHRACPVTQMESRQKISAQCHQNKQHPRDRVVSACTWVLPRLEYRNNQRGTIPCTRLHHNHGQFQRPVLGWSTACKRMWLNLHFSVHSEHLTKLTFTLPAQGTLFKHKKIKLWNKCHFVENKTHIMQHVLKKQ